VPSVTDSTRKTTVRIAPGERSFTSTFNGGFDGWVQEVPGTFSTANNCLTNTTSAAARVRRDMANADFQMKFTYRDTGGVSGPEAQIQYRSADGGNCGLLRLTRTACRVSEKQGAAVTDLATAAWSTTWGAWYEVTVIADGAHVEVWRGLTGTTPARVCSVDSATILCGSRAYIQVGAGGAYSFKNFQMTAEDPASTTYAYDAANQLTTMTANGTATNYTYDDWGRMAGKTQGSYSATYGYRFGDKLKSVRSNFPGENAAVDYNYDGLGKRRVEQLDNSTLTWFRWDGWEECGEYAGTVGSWTVGALQTGYVPGGAAFAGSSPATGDWRFFLNDHLGSPRQMLGQNKAAKARYDFSPYGEPMRSAGLPLTVGYTGHRWDAAIGQYFAPFRYYNPQTARWNMRDPLGAADGLNVYAYVAGNPVKYRDIHGLSALPSGRFPCRQPSSNPRGSDTDDNDPDNDYKYYPEIPKDVYTGARDILNEGAPPWPAGNDRNGNPKPGRWQREGDGYYEILNDDRKNGVHGPHVDYMKIHPKDRKQNLKVRTYPADINKGEYGLMCEQDTSVGGENGV